MPAAGLWIWWWSLFLIRSLAARGFNSKASPSKNKNNQQDIGQQYKTWIPNHFDTLQWASRHMARPQTIEQVEQNKGRSFSLCASLGVDVEVLVSVSHLLQFRFQFHLEHDSPATERERSAECGADVCSACMCATVYARSSTTHRSPVLVGAETILLNGAIFLVIWQSHRWHFYAVFDSAPPCGYKSGERTMPGVSVSVTNWIIISSSAAVSFKCQRVFLAPLIHY